MNTITKKLECIGDDMVQALRSIEQFERIFFPNSYRSADRIKSRAWIAIIKDCYQGKLQREFPRSYKDYSEANSKGSRGVYKYYYLEEGYIYEISEPTSWKNTSRYFCRIENGEEIRMTKQEVIDRLRQQIQEGGKKISVIMPEEEFFKWLKKDI